MDLISRLKVAAEKDPDILSDKSALEETLGSDAKYLDEILGLNKSDLKKLEKKGLAVKCRYATQSRSHYFSGPKSHPVKVEITGPHRIRWVIFQEAIK